VSASPASADPSRRWTTLALAALVIAVVFRRALGGEVLYRRDVHLMWYTQVEAIVRAVAAGEWPVWNADIGFGQPLWADANVQILYPPTWLNFVVRPWTCYTVFVVAHLLLAALGARALGRALGLGPAAAAAAGLFWMAGGPVLSLGEVWNQLAGAAWMPWALAAAVQALGRGSACWAVALGACLAAQVLAGSPEALLLTAAGGLGLAIVARPWRQGGPGARTRAARAVLLALAIALGLSAAQWLPSLAAAAESGRAHLPAEARGYWSVHPAGLVQLVLPLAADALPLRPEVASVMFGGRDPLLPSLYLGLGTVPFAAAAFLGGRRRAAAALLAAFAGALALALGPHLFVQPLLTTLVPPLRALRYPVKAMPAAGLAWALLCALGLEVWRKDDRDRPRRRWTVLVLVPAVILGTLSAAAAIALFVRPDAIGAAVLTPGSPLPSARLLAPARQALAVATTASLAMIAIVLARRSSRLVPPLATLAGAAVAVADLTAAHGALVPTAPRALFTVRPPILEAARPPDQGRLYAYDYFVPGRSLAHLSRAEPFAIARAPVGWSVPAATALSMRLSLFPPTAAPWGIPGSFDHDTPGIAPWRSSALLDALLGREGTPAAARLLALGAVGRVVALHAYEGLPLLATGDALLPEPVRVMAVPGARPRAWAVPAARIVADDAQALQEMLDPGFEPSREVVLAAGPAGTAGRGPGFASSVSVDHVGADAVRMHALLSDAGYVVLADAWAPGWTARVDGVETAVHRANVAFRAVGVTAGRHEIELRYRPRGLTAGLVITALSIAAALAAARGRDQAIGPSARVS
jgi:hypothetical protein